MKRRRSSTFGVQKRPKKRVRVTTTTISQGGRQRRFVQRSLGNPLAITERKYYTNYLSNTAIVSFAAGTTWAGMELDPATQNCLFSPSTGDEYNTRDGRKVQVLGIKIKGLITVPGQTDQTGADDGAMVRLALVLDKQTNATQLNAEDVFGGVAVAAVNFAQFQNPAFFGRFKVLKDKTYVIQNPSTTYDGTNIEANGLVKAFKLSHKFRKPLIVHFNGTNGGTIADIIDNSLHLIGGANNVELVPNISYQVRTTFIDV